MPQIAVSATPDPLSIEAARIEEENQPFEMDVVAPLQAGLQAGGAVVETLGNIEETKKAKEFESLLQSGEEGMKAAIADAQAKGVDLTGIPDPKLYLRTKEDSASWYTFLADRIEKHEKKAARGEAFEEISGGDAKAGFGKLVQTGDLSAAEAGKEVRQIDFRKRLASHVSGETKIVDEGVDAPEGATVIKVTEFSPAPESIGESLKARGLPQPPDEIKTSIESAAKKLGIPASVLIGIAARESANFDPKSKNPISSATGLGQLLAKSTGKEMFAKAQEEGFIGKDVKFEDAIIDPEMNMIMTGLLFKENLETTGNVRDALLAHRIGAGAVGDFNKTGKFVIEGRDESADIKDWIEDVMTVSFEDSIPGSFSDGSNDLFNLQGINNELERLRSNTEFSATPEVKVAIKVLEDRKDDLIKKKAASDKAAGKKGVTDKEKNVANTIDLVVALAEGVPPSGILKGSFKNLLGWLKIDAPTATLNQFSGLLAGQMAKGVGGESGRLTDQDRAFALAAMPTATDSEEIRANKVAILNAIVENIRDANSGDVEAQRRLRKAVFSNAAKFGKTMDKETLKKSWKNNPSDGLLEAYLWSNGRDATPEAVAKLRSILEGGVKPIVQNQPAGVTTIQASGDSIAPPPVAPPQPQGGGLGLDLPPFEPEK